jgi:hypothetical protein
MKIVQYFKFSITQMHEKCSLRQIFHVFHTIFACAIEFQYARRLPNLIGHYLYCCILLRDYN